MLGTVPRPKIRDVVAERLKSYIISEDLSPGDRLPTETELATSFGVSRLSLREATNALEFLGIVESRTGVGLTVGQIDLQRVTNHLGFHPSLHKADPDQLIDSRVIIETGVLPHIAKRMAEDSSIHARLQVIVDKSRSATRLQEWIDLDIEFHRALIESSGLLPLVAFSDLLQVFFRQFRDNVKKAEWKTGIVSHQKIINSLASQDIETAVTEITWHVVSHRQQKES